MDLEKLDRVCSKRLGAMSLQQMLFLFFLNQNFHDKELK